MGHGFEVWSLSVAFFERLRDMLTPTLAGNQHRSVWHLLQEEWRLLLVTPERYSARMKL